ncbi:hypothetical protein CYMTET_10777 [Cymbomonas tetramitiformis]|uniref:Reverse transcriptase domain-containing protein n=1 Tax=Cymbomonas tetramitiformis TaxID=36881 RepID=A0AAE0GNT2_9CHLO|nr:hypothetical protein CYMTET_10777 [Cymbomonas tetramitiformis]
MCPLLPAEGVDMDIDAEREASRTDSNEENVDPGGGETTTIGSPAPVEPGHRLMNCAGDTTGQETTRVTASGGGGPTACPPASQSEPAFHSETPCVNAKPRASSGLPVDDLWNFCEIYSADGEFMNPCEVLGERVWTSPTFDASSETFRDLLASWHGEWAQIDLSAHGVSLSALAEFKSSTEAIGAEVPLVTKWAHRWAMLFRDDANVTDLVRSVSLGAGWAFDADAVTMAGENYVKEGFEHKVDKLHDEEHKWQSVFDALAFLRPKYHMIKVDIKGAYRHLPIALQYLPYHTYTWGELVADLRFPFGHRAVPGKFHEVTAALIRFMRAQGFSATVGFLDDFWVCTMLETVPRGALEALRLLQDVLEFLGLEVAWEKCEGPVQDVIFLGVRLCTNECGEGRVSASLPVHKCERLRDTTLRLAHGGWCTRRDLERLMGQQAFASRLVRGLSLFCGSGHALLRSKGKWIRARADFVFVAECLMLYNGQHALLMRRVLKPSHFSVDASTGTGMGGFLDGRYFAVSWMELLALPQEAFYPFRDRASSQINYLELFSVFSALNLWGHLLQGLTVVLITDNTPTKGMLEKWRCTPDFRLLLRRIFKQCVQFDIRLVVEWVPSKQNHFADALSRKEMRLFFELHKEWKAESLWRKDKDDWKLFAEVFENLDRRFGPFSVDTCCDAFGANRQTLVCWMVKQDCTKQDWAGHTAWCNPPFSRILSILLHFLACKRRQNVGTSACFVIPVWPTADFYKFIVARPSVFIPVERFEAETDLFLAPDCEGGDKKFYGPTRWPVVVYRVPPCFVQLD